jgi:hypothetical protein
VGLQISFFGWKIRHDPSRRGQSLRNARTLFTRAWESIPAEFGHKQVRKNRRADKLDEMLKVAELAGKGIDFVWGTSMIPIIGQSAK